MNDHQKRSVLLAVIVLVILLLVSTAIAVRSCGPPQPLPTASPSGPPAAQEPEGEGALVVSGTGDDLYYVFDSTGHEKVGFTRTNSEMPLPAGAYVVALNGTRQDATIQAQATTTLASGQILVSGIGQDLYRVFNASGQDKLGFTTTNKPFEVFPGAYVVSLNGARDTVVVEAGGQAVAEAGRIVVQGDGEQLYRVYDSTGERKLQFTSTGKEIELLPGDYVVVLGEDRWPATVTAGERTVVVPE